ncbi:cytochrome c-type biogenesis protein CcmH [Bacillus sp. 1P10SD]|uniref:cytochrome c-type biogenesis protein CcmH n=1 Tax=Bacillus sp. 1P10SD TaxID=3132265 RepID=UPI0039A4010E
MKRLVVVMVCFLLTMVTTVNVAVIEAKAKTKTGISYSDPEFRATVDMLAMDGHSNDDLSSCAVKQEYYKDVVEMFDKGMSKQEILDYYENELGVQALLYPPAKGFNLTLWMTPYLLLAVVSILLFFIFKKWKSNRPELVMAEDTESEKELETELYIAMIEEERKKMNFY